MAWKKFVVGFDPHGAQQDEKANKSFFKFVKLWKPDIRVAGGDVFDFAQLRKKADVHEKRDSMADDVAMGKQWLIDLNPTHYLRGNHCERLWDLARQSEGVLADYAKDGCHEIEELCKKLKCRMLPYDKREGVVRIGHLKVIHGFHCGVSAARRAALVYGSVLMGHAHSIQCSSIEGLDPRMGRICGCLCKLSMDYCRHQPGTLAWAHGWCYGIVDDRSGDYQVWQSMELNGKWMLPTGVEEL